jgi:hypothetical protein
MPAQSLYARIGGREAVEAVVSDFYDRVLADDSVAHYFDDIDMVEQRRPSGQAHQRRRGRVPSSTTGPICGRPTTTSTSPLRTLTPSPSTSRPVETGD